MSAPEVSLGGLPIAAGDVLLKKYKVERLIGEGGTGIVLAATHLQLQQRVAIKFLRRALASDEVRTRFEREARAMGSIESEHVVVVLDAGTLDDGAPYMVMEHLDGRDLARVLKEDGPLPVEQAVDCMLQACRALGLAHANGIVHRDLKPANLFLSRRADGSMQIKVLDFGISKFLDKKLLDDGASGPLEVTSAFTVLGSPRYMAPEQVRNSKDVDHRADLWSVGAVLYQLLTGKHAFKAETNVQASVAVLSAEPASLCEALPEAPPALEAVVKRCLTRDVDARFQSAEELAAALLPFASAEGKDSQARMKTVNESPRLFEHAVGVSASSMPPRRSDPELAHLAPGQRDVPTEPKLRVAAPTEPVVPSTRLRVDERAPPPSKRAAGISLWAALAFVVVVGGITTLVVKRSHHGGPSPATGLDAGAAAP